MSKDYDPDTQASHIDEQIKPTPETALPFSRRQTLLSVLGGGSLNLFGSQPVPWAGSSNKSGRPWNRDVDAQGHQLMNLGALTTADNPTKITDFVGENLSITNDGVLNARGVSPWADTDEDGLLETPGHDGIDIEKTTTQQVTVGDGNPVTGLWGDSSELVPLLTIEANNFGVISGNTTSFSVLEEARDLQCIVPFERFSYTNISQLYVSLFGIIRQISSQVLEEISPLPVSWRLRDAVTETSINSTETEITLTETTEFPVVVIGSRGAYNSEANTILQFEGKLSHGIGGAKSVPLRNLGIRVWGEIA